MVSVTVCVCAAAARRGAAMSKNTNPKARRRHVFTGEGAFSTRENEPFTTHTASRYDRAIASTRHLRTFPRPNTHVRKRTAAPHVVERDWRTSRTGRPYGPPVGEGSGPPDPPRPRRHGACPLCLHGRTGRLRPARDSD